MLRRLGSTFCICVALIAYVEVPSPICSRCWTVWDKTHLGKTQQNTQPLQTLTVFPRFVPLPLSAKWALAWESWWLSPVPCFPLRALWGAADGAHVGWGTWQEARGPFAPAGGLALSAQLQPRSQAINYSALLGMLATCWYVGCLEPALDSRSCSSVCSIRCACARGGKARDGSAWGLHCNAFATSKHPCKAGQEQPCSAVWQSGCGGLWLPPKAAWGPFAQCQMWSLIDRGGINIIPSGTSCFKCSVSPGGKSGYCSCVMCVQACYRRRSRK